MNFLDYVDNDKLKLVNTISTINKNLCSIFNLKNSADSTEQFSAKISGLSSISAYVWKDMIYFSVTGLNKYRMGFKDEEIKDNLKNNLLPKLKSTVDDYWVNDYSMAGVRILFSELNTDVINDIMLLVNGTNAQLKPTKTESF